MPLDITHLTISPGLPGAGGRSYPLTHAAAAAEWRAAVEAYTLGVVPVVVPATMTLALDAFEAACAAAFVGGAVSGVDDAFTALGLAMAAAMAPAATGVAPIGPLGLASLFGAGHAATRAEGVARVAGRIDAWMRTGTAALSTAPASWFVWS